MNRKNLKCFVAMRIGEKDTDLMYHDLIRPTLKKMGIDARHVADVEHNENIDDKILKLLKERDFVIADLTYARPSVYYEAGYAESLGKKVVFTCRADHFKATYDSKYGELKVHFDLQMKNIIPWTSPGDKKFAKKLMKRVNHVVKPLLTQIRESGEEQNAVNFFAQRPLRDRIEEIRTICQKKALADGYQGSTTDQQQLYKWLRLPEEGYVTEGNFSTVYNRMRFLNPGWLGTKKRAGVLQAIYFTIVNGFTKNDMRDVRQGILNTPICNLAPLVNSELRNRELREQIVICNLGKTDLTKFSSILSQYFFQRDGKRASLNTTWEVLIGHYRKFYQIFALEGYLNPFFGRKRGDEKVRLHQIDPQFKIAGYPYSRKIKRVITISTIDSIKSIPDFSKRLEKVL